VGFESPFAARRRLSDAATARAALFEVPADALLAAVPDVEVPIPTSLEGALERLAGDILDTPGAGGALLVAFAAQTRALHLVAEAALRAPTAPLPRDVLQRVQQAIATAAPVTARAATA
jgi:hypothetical protein